MSCKIQCTFPTATDDKRPFSLYQNSTQGFQELVAGCGYTGKPLCSSKKGFEITHNGFNDVTITVPDTFAREGSFECQKGDMDMVKNCSYHPPGIPTMSCKIQCTFPTETDDKRPFSLYQNSTRGFQEIVVACAYNGGSLCSKETGFEITHNGFNDVTITVPDTFARKGSFKCQKGDTDIVKSCPRHPPEISNYISSTKSAIDLGTTTKGIHSSVTADQFRNEGISRPALVAAIVTPIVAIALIIIIIGSVWFRRRRSEGRKRPKKSTIYIGVPPVIPNGKSEKPFLGNENTGYGVEQTQTGCESVDYMDVLTGTSNPTKRDNVLTVNKQTANITQEPSSSDNPVSGDSSGLQKTEYLSSKTSLSGSDGSDTPFLSTKFN